MNASIRRASKDDVITLIQTYHYSKQLPRLTKEYLGYFTEDGRMIGAITLGWGTRPKHTIQKLWAHLDSSDYYEIGKMAVADDLPKNTASQMLSAVIKFVRKEMPHIKVLFTWADGMLGKAGYVYQASNFLYLGYSETDSYFTTDGERVHPRTANKLLDNNDERTTKFKRPTDAQLTQLGWSHYKGRQFRYAYVIDRKMREELLRTCKVEITNNFPKDADLKWRIKKEKGVWVDAPPPPFNKSSTNVYDTKGKYTI